MLAWALNVGFAAGIVTPPASTTPNKQQTISFAFENREIAFPSEDRTVFVPADPKKSDV